MGVLATHIDPAAAHFGMKPVAAILMLAGSSTASQYGAPSARSCQSALSHRTR